MFLTFCNMHFKKLMDPPGRTSSLSLFTPHLQTQDGIQSVASVLLSIFTSPRCLLVPRDSTEGVQSFSLVFTASAALLLVWVFRFEPTANTSASTTWCGIASQPPNGNAAQATSGSYEYSLAEFKVQYAYQLH